MELGKGSGGEYAIVDNRQALLALAVWAKWSDGNNSLPALVGRRCRLLNPIANTICSPSSLPIVWDFCEILYRKATLVEYFYQCCC